MIPFWRGASDHARESTGEQIGGYRAQAADQPGHPA
jgi:hypothetical protein